jgi:[calcium/calmodulin-dependent protein kinase] kinase
VVNLHEIIETQKNLVMVLDYCQQGQIMDYDEDTKEFLPLGDRKYFTEVEVQRIMRDLVIGLQYCHLNNVCHRDIKPQNILVDCNGSCKLADFGSASFLTAESDQLKDQVGTMAFFSPEMCDTKI